MTAVVIQFPGERRIRPRQLPHWRKSARQSGQHFLVSAAYRTLSLKEVYRITEQQAWRMFKDLRWPRGVRCPRCNGAKPYRYVRKRGKMFCCRKCKHQFTVTSGTIFQNRKMELRDILAALALCVGASKGISALQMARYLDHQYKTIFVLCHKIREAIEFEQRKLLLSGKPVEIDGAYFGGYLERANSVRAGYSHRTARRRYVNRRVVVVARQRFGRTVTFVGKKESDAIFTIRRQVADGTTIYADQAHAWSSLQKTFNLMRIDHSKAFKVQDHCTNNAESFWSMLRRMQMGGHHRMSSDYLHLYAAEMAWKQDHRFLDYKRQWTELISLAINSKVQSRFRGYWQRSKPVIANASEA